ncbi:MAG: hypothetical protein LUG18_09340 [Candidatus Azobacteroides sp.]|nr:hypothetical protein [Candidatus Azobacteroides sp.]
MDILKINRKDLSHDEDLYYYYNETLFTGVAYWYYPDGTLASEEYFKNGIPDGKNTVWYKNGQKKVEKEYKAGCIHGFVRKWYESGQIQEEDEIYNGKSVALKQWDEKGLLLTDKNTNE